MFLIGFSVTMTFADDAVEQQAITVVNDFLTYLDSNEHFSYEKETYFLGDHSILASVLYMRANLMNTSGRWRTKEPRNSLLGHVLKQKQDIFRFPLKAQKIIFCKKDNNSNSCFVVCLYQKETGKSQVSNVSNSAVAKVLVFRVTNFIQPNIDLLESSIDGISIPYLLGFSLKEINVKSAGKIRTKKTLTIAEENLSFMIKNYTMD